MNDILHIRTLFLLAIALTVLILAFRSLRAGRLKERFVLLFVLTGIPFLVFALWPDLIVTAERTLEIEKPTLLILCVSTYFILTTFALLSIVSVQDRKIQTLGQLVSILAAESESRGETPAQRANVNDAPDPQTGHRRRGSR